MRECVPSKPKILLLILCMLAIFSTSLISIDLDVSILRSFFQIKALLFNMMHIPLFMILTVLWLQITQVYGLERWKNILSAVLVTSFVGILYELTQMTIPGRNPSLHDVLFNSLGSMLGIILYCKLEHASPSTLKRLVCQ